MGGCPRVIKNLPLVNASLRPIDALSFGLTEVSPTGSGKNSGPCMSQTLEYSAALHPEEIYCWPGLQRKEGLPYGAFLIKGFILHLVTLKQQAEAWALSNR